jgi:nucleoid-associated protein YgaU
MPSPIPFHRGARRQALVVALALLLPGSAVAQQAGAPAAADDADMVPRAELDALQARLDQAEAELNRLRAALANRDTLEQQLSQRLESLRARLPAPEGGSLTAAEARHRAEADAAALKALIADARGIDNPQLGLRLRETENALHRSQYLVARTDNARTVYRLRPGDTLPQVAWLFYGDSEQWARIFDANRHVLDDPAQVQPGLTLVIP